MASLIRRSIRTVKNSIHLLIAYLANALYGFPSRTMTVIGVTGTDGKTTTSSLLYHILQESGEKAALISTVGAFMEGKRYSVGFHVTTPSPFFLQRYIKKAHDCHTKYLVLEVTSHALDQNRIAGINFDATILTNITHEHLDYHGSYANYVNAKVKLLLKSSFNVVNLDDASFPFVKKRVPIDTLYTYSLASKDADITLKNFDLKINLFGDFNKSNALAAVAIAKRLGISDAAIKKGLLSFSAPDGRQEIIEASDYKVIIDFAHTPNAFEQMLPEARKILGDSGRLIHVFGSAGMRDSLKRPKMGEISSRNADVIILTAEDPRVESVSSINSQIKKGIDKKFKELRKEDYVGQRDVVIEIEDRKEALRFAVSIAKRGDVVIATGKGHEQSMNLGNGELPWDEKKIIKDAI